MAEWQPVTRRLAITAILTLIPVLDVLPAEAHQRRSRSYRSVSPVRGGRPAAKYRKASRPRPQPPADANVWDRLAHCESGGRWHLQGRRYSGGLQFLPSTWRSVGGTGMPHEHSREEQIYRAEILLARSGWGQWPACSRKLGLR